MKSIRLIFGTHNSLPAGSDESFNESVYQDAYKPFLTLLNRYPNFQAVLHYSGYLLEWIGKAHPEYIMLLSEMVKRNQVELLTGGFYEPILTLIPHADRIGQVEHLTTHLRACFGKRPRGGWLPQGAWEPCLASILATSGVEYTFLDECRFQDSGVSDTNRYYLTEDQGKTVALFPLSQKLKKLIQMSSPEETVKYIVGLADESSDKIVAYIGEGEKLGFSGQTRERYYGKGWLNRFMTLIDAQGAIEATSPGKIAKQSSPKAKIYIRAGASPDVIECLLPVDKARRASALKKKNASSDLKALLDGGLFRQFLCRYRESNWMYSKMMYTNIRVNQIRGDKYRKKTAREEMWKGQSHFGYWHGSMGGIYWPSVRKEHYRAFIEAERLTRTDGIFTPSIISFDFDMDGKNEYVYQGRDINAYVHNIGGMLFELDYIPCRWNYGDTLSRIPEYYHTNGEKDYDRYMRKCFADHFFDQADDVEDFQGAASGERGDFLDQEYELYRLNRENKELILGRDGTVKMRNRSYPVNVKKRYSFKRSGIGVEYTVTNRSARGLDLRFGSELNLSFLSGDSKHLSVSGFEKSKKIKIPSVPNSSPSLGRMLLQDLHNRVQIAVISGEPFALWSAPLETISRSLCRREKLYQGSCFLPFWDFRLEPDQSWSNSITLSFSKQK